MGCITLVSFFNSFFSHQLLYVLLSDDDFCRHCDNVHRSSNKFGSFWCLGKSVDALDNSLQPNSHAISILTTFNDC